MARPAALLLGPAPVRPRPRTLLFAWAVSGLGASLVVWLADAAFYLRFPGVHSSDLPSWSAWSTLELAVQLFAWIVVVALSMWWPRRHVVVVLAVVALAIAGLGTRAWAHDEADRARTGTPVWPRAVLPFTFSARAVTLVPYGTDALPGGIPSGVLLLRSDEHRSVVYVPTTGETIWIGNQIATWKIGAGDFPRH